MLHSVIGTDIAGEVMDVGKGVKKFKAGDKVVGFVSPFVSCYPTIHFISLKHGYRKHATNTQMLTPKNKLIQRPCQFWTQTHTHRCL